MRCRAKLHIFSSFDVWSLSCHHISPVSNSKKPTLETPAEEHRKLTIWRLVFTKQSHVNEKMCGTSIPQYKSMLWSKQVLIAFLLGANQAGYALSPVSKSDRLVHFGETNISEGLSSELGVIAASPYLISENNLFIAGFNINGELTIFESLISINESLRQISDMGKSRNRPGVASFLRITDNGSIELSSGRSFSDKVILWKSDTEREEMCHEYKCSLIMQNDGNLAAYQENVIFWSSDDGEEKWEWFQNQSEVEFHAALATPPAECPPGTRRIRGQCLRRRPIPSGR